MAAHISHIDYVNVICVSVDAMIEGGKVCARSEVASKRVSRDHNLVANGRPRRRLLGLATFPVAV